MREKKVREFCSLWCNISWQHDWQHRKKKFLSLSLTHLLDHDNEAAEKNIYGKKFRLSHTSDCYTEPASEPIKKFWHAKDDFSKVQVLRQVCVCVCVFECRKSSREKKVYVSERRVEKKEEVSENNFSRITFYCSWLTWLMLRLNNGFIMMTHAYIYLFEYEKVGTFTKKFNQHTVKKKVRFFLSPGDISSAQWAFYWLYGNNAAMINELRVERFFNFVQNEGEWNE